MLTSLWFFQADGRTIDLDIDILGNMMEASILSPNRELYGSIHNNGHSFSAYMHDPQHRYLVSRQAVLKKNSNELLKNRIRLRQ